MEDVLLKLLCDMFLHSFKQKYLDRFYKFPSGLQGSQTSPGAFQTKLMEMQKFFKIKVNRCRNDPTYPKTLLII